MRTPAIIQATYVCNLRTTAVQQLLTGTLLRNCTRTSSNHLYTTKETGQNFKTATQPDQNNLIRKTLQCVIHEMFSQVCQLPEGQTCLI